MKSPSAAILAYLHDEATPQEVEALFAWIKQDPEHAREFARIALLHSHLRAQLGGEQQLRAAAESPTLLARGYRFVTRPTPLSLSAAALVVGLLVTAMAFMAPPIFRTLTRAAPPEVADQYRIVAEVSGIFEAVWEDERSAVRAEAFLRKGRRLALRSGAVKVRFRGGATITLAGPCAFVVDDVDRGTLQFGELVASVPPSAVGFTIDGPALRLIDLGTEFAVAAEPGGSVTVDVLQGRVRAEPKTGPRHEFVELLAGQSLQFDGAWHVAASDTSRHAQWRSLARRTDVQRIAGVTVVDCSSEMTVELFDRRAACLVDGSGLLGHGHTAVTEPVVDGRMRGTMWLNRGTYAEPHDPLPAHVTFDLGDVYELTSLHVWNYNEARRGFVTRGAREVEISVSPTESSADLVPLAAAEENTPQGNFVFPVATGQGDYGGFAVPLPTASNAEALARVRLVRLTILSNHGPNPREESDQLTGLSEVRFAGRTAPRAAAEPGS